LSIAVTTGFGFAGFAQAYITLDGSNNSNPSPSATSSGLVFLIDPLNNLPNDPIPGGHIPGYDSTDFFYDINVELLYGTTPNTVNTPVVTLLRSSNNTGTGSSALGQVLSASGDMTDRANGQLLDSSSTEFLIPSVSPGNATYFRILAWTGNVDSYSAAQADVFNPQTGQFFSQYTGTSPIFSEILNSGPFSTVANIENMPALILNPSLDTNGFVIPEPSPLKMAGIGIGSMLVFGCRNMIRRK
jgi:hypothetical protein